MAVKIYSAQVVGLSANIVDVEADLIQGLHSFSVVGLPDKAVEESKDRISAAIKNSGFTSPKKKNQKITISLAPADLKKEGPAFDLAMALVYLMAGKQIVFNAEDKIFLGELALGGDLRPIKGVLPLTQKAKESGFKEIFLPIKNAKEAALIKGIKVFGCRNLKEIADHFSPQNSFNLLQQTPVKINLDKFYEESLCDFADIKGQESAKRGLEIAAAGGHNVMMSGPAGTGKTMLAKAFPHILPPLSFEEMLEATSIHSVAGVLSGNFIVNRPFRSPHHTSSYVAIVGGGAHPKPGEITLSHRGVLFMDEFPEFERRVIEAMRQPLEEGVVNISRARGSISFPARFILICAMNPCPCGNAGSKTKECVCAQGALVRYQRKISGPIMDRIDLWLDVPQVDYHKLSDDSIISESSSLIRERVTKARERQKERFHAENSGKTRIISNSEMGAKEIKKFAPLDESLKKILNMAAVKLNLSGRAYHRVIKLSRTIADLAGEDNIKQEHLMEALQYRPK